MWFLGNELFLSFNFFLFALRASCGHRHGSLGKSCELRYWSTLFWRQLTWIFQFSYYVTVWYGKCSRRGRHRKAIMLVLREWEKLLPAPNGQRCFIDLKVLKQHSYFFAYIQFLCQRRNQTATFDLARKRANLNVIIPPLYAIGTRVWINRKKEQNERETSMPYLGWWGGEKPRFDGLSISNQISAEEEIWQINREMALS